MTKNIPLEMKKIPTSMVAELEGITKREILEGQIRTMFKLNEDKTIKALSEMINDLRDGIILHKILLEGYEEENKALKEEVKDLKNQLNGTFTIVDEEATNSLLHFIEELKK